MISNNWLTNSKTMSSPHFPYLEHFLINFTNFTQLSLKLLRDFIVKTLILSYLNWLYFRVSQLTLTWPAGQWAWYPSMFSWTGSSRIAMPIFATWPISTSWSSKSDSANFLPHRLSITLKFSLKITGSSCLLNFNSSTILWIEIQTKIWTTLRPPNKIIL